MKRYFFNNNKEVDNFSTFLERNLSKERRKQLAVFEFSSRVGSRKIKKIIIESSFSKVMVILDEKELEKRAMFYRSLQNAFDLDICLRLYLDFPVSGNLGINRHTPHIKKNNVFEKLMILKKNFQITPNALEFSVDEKNIEHLFSAMMVGLEKKIKRFFLRTVLLKDYSLSDKIRSQLELLKMHAKDGDYTLQLSGEVENEVVWKNKLGNHFFGLQYLDIDLSNRCTHSCLFCGLYSPEVIENIKKENQGKLSSGITDLMKMTADKERIMPLIEANADSLQYICLGGVGDPFLHPDILDIMKEIASRDIGVHVFTNYDYITQEQISDISTYSDSSFDNMNIIVNISAATAQTFSRVRPKQKESDFHRIYDRLRYTGELRAKAGKGLSITLMSVMNSLNYHELPLYPFMVVDLKAYDFFPKPLEIHGDEMKKYIISHEHTFEYARLAKLALFFADKLKVPVRMREFLEELIHQHCEQIDHYEMNDEAFMEQVESFLKKYKIAFDEYLEKAKNREVSSWRAEYWPSTNPENYVVSNARKYDQSYGDLLPIRVKQGKTYAESFYSSYPCRIGEVYARVLVDGGVLPCCVSDYPVGNLYSKSISEIRASQQLQLFNDVTRNFPNDRKFEYVGEWGFCKNCCHIQKNKKINFFTNYIED